MKKAFKLALWRQLTKKGESGFSLPLVLVFGLIMLLSGVTMLTRAEGSLRDSIGQRKIQDIKENLDTNGDGIRTEDEVTPTAEILRKLAFLNEMRRSLHTDRDEESGVLYQAVQNPNQAPEPTDWELIYPINSFKTVKQLFDEAALDPNPKDPENRNRVKLVEYSYDEQVATGTFIFDVYDVQKTNVESKVDVQKTNVESKVKVKVKLTPAEPSTTNPAENNRLYSFVAENIELKNNDVIGRIACVNPSKDSQMNNRCILPDENQYENSSKKLTYDQQRAAISADVGAIIKDPINLSDEKAILIGTMDLPLVPTLPQGAPVNNLGSLTGEDITLPYLGEDDDDEDDDDDEARQPDQAYQGVYYYSADSIMNSSILVQKDKKVRIYVKGDMELNADDYIAASEGDDDDDDEELRVPNPGQIVIYGNDSDPQNPAPQNPAPQNILIHGDACVMALIHAPKAELKINSSGQGNMCRKIFEASKEGDYEQEFWNTIEAYKNLTQRDPNIFGAVWVKGYKNDGNDSVFWEQPGLMQSLWQYGQYESTFYERLLPRSMSIISWIEEKVES